MLLESLGGNQSGGKEDQAGSIAGAENCSQDGWYVRLDEAILRVGLAAEQVRLWWEYASDG